VTVAGPDVPHRSESPVPEAVLVAAARSPIGRAVKGSLKDVRPDDLVAQMIRTALDQVPALDRHDVDDVYVGCGLPGGESGFNMARIVNVMNGMDDVPGATITRYCASSVQTTRMAFHAIRAGEGHAFVSAGVETVSRYAQGNSDSWPNTRNARYADAMTRTADRAEHGSGGEAWHDPREDGVLPDAYIAMGQTAENVATLRGLTRRELDEFGVRSQNLAEKALADGFWQREITPVTTPDGTVVSADDGPRSGVTLEGVSGLKPVFRPDGVVTAGNCCPLNDGAAAVVVMSDTRAAELGITPLARVVATGVSALSPEIMGLGPVEATRRALTHAGMTIEDMDLVEINEAFAAQVVPSYQDLGIDLDRLNVNGGAIAVGHPFGMTGARLQTTMLNSLEWHDKSIGLVTMCVGGGQGMALILERLA
jgi:acetyl-CoA C-acetyltransferase